MGPGGRLCACLLLFPALLLLASPDRAWAEGGNRLDRLRSLFTTQQPKRAAPPKQAAPARRKPAPPRHTRRAAPVAPAVGPATPPKAQDARVLLVFGDRLAAFLAQGLTETFGREPALRVVWKPAPSPSLASAGAGTWANTLGRAIEAEKPAVVLVMLGADDRRRMRLPDGRRARLLDEPWRAEYASRVNALARVPRERSLPLFWIGLPPARDAAASRDFLAFNEIARTGLPEGATFVDSWNGFANEAGAFTAKGPAIDGRDARLRRSDGVGFTAAGARKLAFFAARPLAPALGLAFDDDPASPFPGAVPALLRTGPGSDLSATAANRGELLGGPQDVTAPPDPAGAVPLDPVVPRGRADSFGATP